MFVRGNHVIVKVGIVFFIHSILMDKATDTASSIGQNVEVKEERNVALSKLLYIFTCKMTLEAQKKIKKEVYVFTVEEQDERENMRNIKLSNDEHDDFEIEDDFSDY